MSNPMTYKTKDGDLIRLVTEPDSDPRTTAWFVMVDNPDEEVWLRMDEVEEVTAYTPPPALTPMEQRSIQWTEEHYREGA